MSIPDKVVLASSNPGKLREIRAMLRELGLNILPQSDFSVPAVAETGLSFVENAILKARQATHHTELPAIADDSGIEVDVLNGAPGIYSARYAGEGASDEANLRLLIENILETGIDKPTARFQCVMVYMQHTQDPVPVIAQGTWEGYLVTEPRGKNGFGYDPIFYVSTHGCTSAELPPQIKNQISHRGQALHALVQKLSILLARSEHKS